MVEDYSDRFSKLEAHLCSKNNIEVFSDLRVLALWSISFFASVTTAGTCGLPGGTIHRRVISLALYGDNLIVNTDSVYRELSEVSENITVSA